MATVLVIVSDVSSPESDEMALAQNYDVIEELAPTAADPALGGTVLPRATIRGANRLRAHGPYELDDRLAEDRVAVKDEVSRRRVVGKRLTQLLHHPSGRRMERGVEVNDMPTAVVDDEEAVQQPKRRRRHREQIHRSNVVLVVAQERYPSLHLVGLGWAPRQVSRHRHLGHDESELRELRVDTRYTQPS